MSAFACVYAAALAIIIPEVSASDLAMECSRCADRSTTGVNLIQLKANPTSASAIRSVSSTIDVVVVAHHDDAPILLKYALPSIFHSINGLRYVFIVGTPQLIKLVQDIKTEADPGFPTGRVFVVSQEMYPFNLEQVKAARLRAGLKNDARDQKDRHAWTYQQLLKLYSHTVLAMGSGERPALSSNALIADADVVWLRPTSFIYQVGSAGQDICWYSVASKDSGAFEGDALYGDDDIQTLLGAARLHEALPDQGRKSFTGVTHHSVFQADVVRALLDEIATENSIPAWEALADTKPFLSEYDLYLSWAASKFPERVALRSLPYINSGLAELHHIVSGTSVLAYAAFHDDYPAQGHCCVNVISNDFADESGHACGGCETKLNLKDQSRATERLRHCQLSVYPEIAHAIGNATSWASVPGADSLRRFAACAYSTRN
eukprot:TRINITY_DN42774_c0_g1_i1.p1 TRINITY_DN42774_c0_g1~~TRINITY_DN42774_c0_g1_i1.p1  ORF type:complete len:434 (+),score=64.70 TRINITY_DN42774_c0_g1_i1:57-1358(+)